MVFAAMDMMSLWSQWLWPILLFVLGLGLVIFVHELGHFLVAKAVGIKVERFALGMGPRVIGVRAGETDYCLCAFPIGGYVKMLGQEDFKPLEEGGKPDPRSYEAKSVGARLAVISAGVVMNVILAAVLFTLIGLLGRSFVAPVVGETVPGMPAASARIDWNNEPATSPTTGPATAPALPDTLQPGDRIVRIDGDSVVLWVVDHEITNFPDIAMTAVLADRGQTFRLHVERDVDGRTRSGVAEVSVAESGGVLRFGIQPASSLTVAAFEDARVDSPLEPGDRVVAIDGATIDHHWQLRDVATRLTGRSIPVTVRRGEERIDVTVQPLLAPAPGVYWLDDGGSFQGTLVSIEPGDGDGEDDDAGRVLTFRLADGSTRKVPAERLSGAQLQILGMAPRQRVLGVMAGSPADEAGIEPGDVILDYADRTSPTHEQVLEINTQYAGEGTNIVVLRDGETVGPLWIVPQQREGGARMGTIITIDQAHPVVAEVADGSVAAAAGIPSGATITAVDDAPVDSWIDLYRELAARTGKSVEIRYRHGAAAGAAEIELTADAFDPSHYRFRVFGGDVAFEPLTRHVRQPGVWASMKWGARETVKLVLSTYASLKSLIAGTAGKESISGPVGIGGFAIEAGRRGVMDFLYFLGFISAALAVFNFLPLPVVDGGHAVFLLIEKIRGKPVPVKVMNWVQMIGLALLILLFVLVTWQDISRMISEGW